MILTDHHEQRRMFAVLDDMHGHDANAIGPVRDRLRVALELHAEAEERLFYPRLLHVGEGEGDKDSASAETKDALHDHNEIRDGIAEADRHRVGTPEWWEAVAATRKANSDHMGEEERESLADFRRHASLVARHDLAVDFAFFESKHASGIDSHDKDPERFIEQES